MFVDKIVQAQKCSLEAIAHYLSQKTHGLYCHD